MRDKIPNGSANLIPYDDSNLAHTEAGPDYGQVDTGSKKLAWTELDSCEYTEFVVEMLDKIGMTKIRIFPSV